MDHAQDRWAQRTDGEDPKDLRSAWQQAIEVPAPEVHGETVRLYAPRDILLVKRDGAVRTVLYADYGRLEIDGYTGCDDCGNLTDPLEDDDCPWCGETLTVDGATLINLGSGSL